MILIAGLGNPGLKYKNTRHNLGFMVIDELARDYDIKLVTDKKNGVFVGDDLISGKKVVLAKPQLFMNNSGIPIKLLVNYFKISLGDSLIVIHDDMDLLFGSIRIRKDGASAGHNGLESIIKEVGSKDFVRVRLGIGRPLLKNKAADYVLSVFSKDETTILGSFVTKAKEAVVSILKEGVENSMNSFNRRQ